MSIWRSAAGPSRLAYGVRSLHTSSAIRAARPRPPPPPPRSSPSQQPAAPARPAERPAKVTLDSRPDPNKSYSTWEWTRVPATATEGKADPSVITEERVIFARPVDIFGGQPQRIKLAWLVAGVFTLFFIAVPDSEEVRKHEQSQLAQAEQAEGQAPEEHVEKEETGVINAFLDTVPIARMIMMAAVLGSAYGVTKIMSGSVTRLVQVRSWPKNTSPEKSTHTVRITTALDLAKMGPFSSGPIEVPLKDTQMYLVLRKHDFVGLSVDGKNRYRLDFGKSKLLDESTEETVISMTRINRLYGELDVPPVKPASAFAQKVDKWAMKGKKVDDVL